MSDNICVFCKHYTEVRWKHSGKGNVSKGCALAITRDGSGGYGPFYSHPSCVHDKDSSPLKDRFETFEKSDIDRYIETVANQKDKIFDLESEIRELQESLKILAKKRRV